MKAAEKSQVFSVRANVFPSTFEPFDFRTSSNGHWSVPEKLSNFGKITLPFNLDQNPRSSKHSFPKCMRGNMVYWSDVCYIYYSSNCEPKVRNLLVIDS
jgi:hypothetical protein